MGDIGVPETVAGVFDDRAAAEDAIRGLEEAGFHADELGFLTPAEGTDPRDDYGKKVVGTAAAAGGAGTVAGGILAALAAGLIPGIGPVIGGGILAAVVGAATGGAGGGVAGMLFSSGAAEDPRLNYSEFLKAGKTVVAVNSVRAEEARSVISRFGGRFPVEPGYVQPPP